MVVSEFSAIYIVAYRLVEVVVAGKESTLRCFGETGVLLSLCNLLSLAQTRATNSEHKELFN